MGGFPPLPRCCTGISIGDSIPSVCSYSIRDRYFITKQDLSIHTRHSSLSLSPTKHIRLKNTHTPTKGRLWVDYIENIESLFITIKNIIASLSLTAKGNQQYVIWFPRAELTGAFETSFGTSMKHVSVGSRNQKQQCKFNFWTRCKGPWVKHLPVINSALQQQPKGWSSRWPWGVYIIHSIAVISYSKCRV